MHILLQALSARWPGESLDTGYDNDTLKQLLALFLQLRSLVISRALQVCLKLWLISA